MKILLTALVAILMGQGFVVAGPPVAAKSLVGQLPALDGSNLQNLSAGNITPGGILPVLDGSNLTNVGEGNTYTSSKTFTSGLLVKRASGQKMLEIASDGSTGVLYNEGGDLTVDFKNMTLKSVRGGTATVLDWENDRLFTESNGSLSIDWKNRNLNDNTSAVVAYWNVSGFSLNPGYIFSGDGSGLTNLPAIKAIQIKTKADFDIMTPALGDTYYCSDCTIPFDICTATGTDLSGFRAVMNSLSTGSLVPKGCGTDE